MGQFAPVAPIQILEAMKEHRMLGNYHLLLTHHVLEHPDRFRELFGKTTFSGGSACTIFMDNSVVELGDAVSDEKVLEACKIVDGANWVYPVLIDVMADGPATRDSSAESYRWWQENAAQYPLMVVAQGNSWLEFCKTVDFFLADPEKFRRIEYVGIPRILVEHIGSRRCAIEYVQAIRPDINIHLLGFSDDVTDDIICCNHPGVEGIDSAVPLRYGYSVPDGVYTPTASIPPRPEDWFEKGTYDKSMAKALINIRKWVA